MLHPCNIRDWSKSVGYIGIYITPLIATSHTWPSIFFRELLHVENCASMHDNEFVGGLDTSYNSLVSSYLSGEHTHPHSYLIVYPMLVTNLCT